MRIGMVETMMVQYFTSSLLKVSSTAAIRESAFCAWFSIRI